MLSRILIFFLSVLISGSVLGQQQDPYAVLVVGGGTGGTAAGIQSARMGVRTIIVEPSPWLGGMLTAAGVSATDGNHRLPSGLWEEFRQQLYKVYGSPQALQTGWVSHTQFEPHVGDSILKAMARREQQLTVLHGWRFKTVLKENGKITGAVFMNDRQETKEIRAHVTIDATELGDVFADAGTAFDIGMEAGSVTGEDAGVEQSSDIIQDLTYVAILKDFGKGTDRTIPQPEGYDPAEFDGACTDYYIDKSLAKPTVNAEKMLEYGRLPNNKYMLNWPIRGNDTYLNIIGLNEKERQLALEKAKGTTLRFTYFIQHQLGYRHLGLADDEFPTADRLALMPYHREGRRVKGLVRFTMKDIATPFEREQKLYRTGISVGDYPIDHHHKKNASAPQHLDFYPVPSFSVPAGALVPQQAEGLIVAEKGISVSNVVNGTTRLQPCVLLTGQAAGALAALSVKQNVQPSAVAIRSLQQVLLNNKAAILPYIDVPPTHPHFKAIQQVGATGILRGKGIPYKWANQTWFYPDSSIAVQDFTRQFASFDPSIQVSITEKVLTIGEAISIIYESATRYRNEKLLKGLALKDPGRFSRQVRKSWTAWGLQQYDPTRAITRAELAVLLNNTIRPFELKQVDHSGNFISTR